MSHYSEDMATLQGYMKAIQQFDALPFEEEQKLAHRVRDKKDNRAAHTLVNAHLRLVVKVASGYRGYGLPMAEIIQEGNMGLMHAVMRFDPERGFRLSTYAMWWIKASIQEYILHSWSLVKIGTTAAQKKLFFNLRKLKAQLQEMSENLSMDSADTIAQTLGVKTTEVLEMNQRMSNDQSLNVMIGDDSESEWMDWLTDDSQTQEEVYSHGEIYSQRRQALNNAIQQLDERERAIVVARHLRDSARTLETLSQRYGISRERIRQLESRAMKKLEKIMTSTLVHHA